MSKQSLERSRRPHRWQRLAAAASALAVLPLSALVVTAPTATASSTVCNKYCDGRDAALATGNRIPVSRTAEGRTVQLHLADGDPMGWASLESAHQGDQIWLDRSWDAGNSWSDGSKLGATTTPGGVGGWRTSMFNNDDWNNTLVGALRACFKSTDTGTNYCTEWARTTWNAGNRETAAQTAMVMRWQHSTGRFENNWWYSAVALRSLIESIRWTGLPSYKYVINETFEKNKDAYQGTFRNEFTDDSGWWGIAWVSAYDLTGDTKYLDAAKTIADYMSSKWSSDCGGGIIWKVGGTYKASISNSLYLKLNSMLTRRISGDTTYKNRATQAWNWINGSGLIQSGDSHVLDGMSTGSCTPSNGGGSYNQGMMIDGLVEYWQATGSSAALTKAQGIGDMLLNTSYYKASGIMRDGCEAGSGVCAGGENFKATAIRGLAALNRVLSNHPYSSYIATNADTAYTNDRDPLAQYGLKWNGPLVVKGVGSQSAALELFNATHL